MVIVHLGLQKLAAVLTFLIPFLPLAFALKVYASTGVGATSDVQNSAAQYFLLSEVSHWVIILPFTALLLSAARRPHNLRYYIFACLGAISLGILQKVCQKEEYLDLPLAISRAIHTVIVLGHLGLWAVHLVDTLENFPVFESLVPAFLGFFLLMLLLTQQSSIPNEASQARNTFAT